MGNEQRIMNSQWQVSYKITLFLGQSFICLALIGRPLNVMASHDNDGLCSHEEALACSCGPGCSKPVRFPVYIVLVLQLSV